MGVMACFSTTLETNGGRVMGGGCRDTAPFRALGKADLNHSFVPSLSKHVSVAHALRQAQDERGASIEADPLHH